MKLLAEQRERLILDWLESSEAVSAVALQERLEVTAMTVWRDLRRLEDKGLLRRGRFGSISDRSRALGRRSIKAVPGSSSGRCGREVTGKTRRILLSTKSDSLRPTRLCRFCGHSPKGALRPQVMPSCTRLMWTLMRITTSPQSIQSAFQPWPGRGMHGSRT